MIANRPLRFNQVMYMNRLWHKFLKASYRRDRISSFILTVGAVDAVIGGVDMKLSLFLLGLGMVGVAIALRHWRTRASIPVDGMAGHPLYLPESSSGPAIPPLNSSRKRSQ